MRYSKIIIKESIIFSHSGPIPFIFVITEQQLLNDIRRFEIFFSEQSFREWNVQSKLSF